ncbi:AIM21 [Candida theae]|uniref:AIM21 n=1 Tax=Candida theae TaxID=1198502 RepID=A0AAD5G0W5_9ASCO|nr:AIM21 [Candida theae]KAI5967472.1 AIM21 [Candida theae]
MSENKSRDELDTSVGAHRTSNVSPQGIPVVPPRPKSKNRTKSTTSLASNSSNKISEREIEPATRDEIEDNCKNEEPELELLDAYGVQPEDHKEEEAEADPVKRSSDISHQSVPSGGSSNDNQVEDIPMNYQTNDQEAIDGDKTPGNSNTRASFKEDIDETNESENEASSFNDDMETVLQESHESNDDVSNNSDDAGSILQETPLVQTQEVSAGLSESLETNEVDKGVDSSEIKQSIEVNDTPKEGGADERATNFDNETPITTVKSLEQTKEASNQDNEKLAIAVGATPVIPARPVRKPKTVRPSLSSEEARKSSPPSGDDTTQKVESNNSAETLPPTETAAQEATESLLSDVVEPKAEKSPNEDLVPKIPARPRPNRKQSESKVTPKAPPPKPKKLSSKIEAFQQQLFNSSSSSNHGPAPKHASGCESNDEVDSAPKQSSVHRRVFESNGIPLPGMFNPALRPVVTESSAKEESPKESKATKRVRGPKGKRLPQAVANANVVSEKSRTLEKGNLWSFTFEKVHGGDGSPEIGTEVLMRDKVFENNDKLAEVSASTGSPAQIIEGSAENNSSVSLISENNGAHTAQDIYPDSDQQTNFSEAGESNEA